jgi:hypothetical protein
MLLGLAYQLTRFLTDWVLVRTGSDAQLRAEVLALRHQLRVLERKVGMQREGEFVSATGSWTRRRRSVPGIVERFWSWTDCDGDLESVVSRDEQSDERADLGHDDRHGFGTGRLLHLPERAAAPFLAMGGEAVPRHPSLEPARERWALRGVRAAGTVRERGALFVRTVRWTPCHCRPVRTARRPPRAPASGGAVRSWPSSADTAAGALPGPRSRGRPPRALAPRR